MKKRTLVISTISAAFAVVLIALPSPSSQNPPQTPGAPATPEWTVQAPPEAQHVEKNVTVFVGDGGSWLGVETQEVDSAKAKDFKLPGEYGVVVSRVTPDSPAAKAGLKTHDVIVALNGQRIEGAVQFRRMIRETPAGRTIQLSIWRDGKNQSLSATLGKAEERGEWTMAAPAAPGTFSFRMPELPEMPAMPPMDMEGNFMYFNRPRLGIEAEDLDGQLGSYFGAPDNEGVLVRSVKDDSPAQKAGLKAGDVITTVNGERVRSLGDLRSHLGAQPDAKTAKLGVLRNKSTLTLDVELPPPAEKKVKRLSGMSTNI